MKNIKVYTSTFFCILTFFVGSKLNSDENIILSQSRGNIYNGSKIIATYDLRKSRIIIKNYNINERIIQFIKNKNIKFIDLSNNEIITDIDISKLSNLKNIKGTSKNYFLQH